MSNTKTIVLLLVGIVLFGLVVCGGGAAYWYFQYFRPGAAAIPDVGPLPGRALLLPADSAVVAGFDAKGFFASAGYKQIASGELKGLGGTLSQEDAERMKKEIPQGLEKALKEAEDKIGIRLDRDLDRVVIAASNVGAPTPEAALIALGRFDSAKVTRALEASAKAEGASLTSKTVQGIAMQVIAAPGKPGAALAFLDDTTLLAGTPAAVESMLTSHAQRMRPLEGNAGMLGLVRGLDAASGYWLVLGPALVERAQKETGGAPMPVPLPRNLTLAGTFDGAIQLAGEMADEAAAQNVVQMVEQGLGMARAQAESPELQKLPGAKQLLDGIKVSAEARTVKISLPATGDGSALAGIVAAAAMPALMKAREAAGQVPGLTQAPPPEATAESPEAEAPAAAAPTPRPAAPARTPRPARAPAKAPASAAAPAPRPAPAAEAPAPAGPVRVGGEVREPRKLKHVSPVYPPRARQSRVQGIVILECTISAQGKVTDVKVLRGVPLLDEAAIDAVRQWVYEPTLLNGVPVPVVMTVTVNFKLS